MRLPVPSLSQRNFAADHIAEVIATSSTEYTAECLPPQHLHFPTVPPLGSWVKAAVPEEYSIIGVVCFASTTPIDTVHRAIALGLSLEELRLQQPQIFAMFRSEIRVAMLGYQTNQHIYQHLPPQPPPIHQGVFLCSPEEIIDFTDTFHFWRTLLQISGVPVDELVSAILRQVYQVRKCDRNWLVQASKHLGILLKDDYDRLRAILAQVHP
jgi:hypothetical protein